MFCHMSYVCQGQVHYNSACADQVALEVERPALLIQALSRQALE